MRIFNVTPSTVIEYRGRTIPPNGGHVDLPDLPFIPDRDKKLERDGLIAFNALPTWFIQKQEMEEASRQVQATPVVSDQKGVALESIILEPSTAEADVPVLKKNRK